MRTLCQGGWNQLKRWAKQLKQHTYTLYLVSRHPDLPWLPRILALAILLYILSPIDLIPDFIPVLGLLDDLILVPIGIWLLLRIVPKHIYENCEATARQEMAESQNRVRAPKQICGAIFVVAIWAASLFWIGRRLYLSSTPSDNAGPGS